VAISSSQHAQFRPNSERLWICVLYTFQVHRVTADTQDFRVLLVRPVRQVQQAQVVKNAKPLDAQVISARLFISSSSVNTF